MRCLGLHLSTTGTVLVTSTDACSEQWAAPYSFARAERGRSELSEKISRAPSFKTNVLNSCNATRSNSDPQWTPGPLGPRLPLRSVFFPLPPPVCSPPEHSKGNHKRGCGQEVDRNHVIPGNSYEATRQRGERRQQQQQQHSSTTLSLKRCTYGDYKCSGRMAVL